MNWSKSARPLALATSAVVFAILTTPRAFAADVQKANNTTNLNNLNSWTGLAVPGTGDVALWDATVTAANTTALGGNVSWLGIRIGDLVTGNPGGLVTISSGSTLTLGASGIDLSNSTQNLTLAPAMTLGAAQTWNTAAATTITASGAVNFGSGLFTKSGLGLVRLSAANSGTAATQINAGTLLISNTSTGSGTITIANGATLWIAGTTNISTAIAVPAGATSFFNPAITSGSAYNGTVNFGSSSSVLEVTASTVNGTLLTSFGGTGNQFTNGTVRIDSGAQARFTTGTTGGGTSTTFDIQGTGFLQGRNVSTVSIGELTGTGELRGGSNGNVTWSIGAKNTSNTFPGSITKSTFDASIIKVGTGTLTLTGSLTYGGTTTVTAGKLLLDTNKTGTGNVIVNGGALGGIGIIPGLTTVNAGGRLTPGDGVGTTTFSALTFTGASSAALATFEFDPVTGNNDTVAVTGALTLSTGTATAFTLTNTSDNSFFSTNGVYTLFTYGTLVGDPAQRFSVIGAPASKTYVFSTDTTSAATPVIKLTISDLPPATPTAWNVDSSGTWSTDSNWTSNSPNGIAQAVTFGNPGIDITDIRTVTLDTNRTAGSLTFNSPVSFTVAATGSTLALDNGAAASAITVAQGNHTVAAPVSITTAGTLLSTANSSDVLTMTGGISGFGNITVSGPGTINLSSPITTSGSLLLAGPGNVTLTLIGTTNVLPATTPLTVASGATVDLNGVAQAVTTVTGPGIIINNAATDANLTISAASTWAGSFRDGSSARLSVTYSGSGTLAITAAQSFSGGLTINSGVVTVNSAAAIGSGPINMKNGSTLTIPVGSSFSYFNPINIAAGANATVITSNAASQVAGTITFSSSTSRLTMNVNNGNQVSLGGGNVFAPGAGTVVATGLVRIVGSSLNGDSVTFVNNGGITTRNEGTFTLGAITGGGTLSSGNANGNTLSATFIIGTKNVDATFSGAVNDAATTHVTNLTKSGTATQTFSGALTNTGNTIVNGGKMILTQAFKPFATTTAGPGGLTITGTSNLTMTAASSATAVTTVGQFSTISVAASGSLTLATSNRPTNRQTLLIANSIDLGANTNGPTGSIDLANNDALIKGMSESAVRTLVASWYHNGVRDGIGLGSSAVGTSTYTSLAVVTNDNLLGSSKGLVSTFDGAAAPFGSILVKYTYQGDTNLDGKVDINDLNALVLGMQDTTLTGWLNGDLNYDNLIDTNDLTLLTTALTNQGTAFDDIQQGQSPTGAIPEPSSLALIPLATAFLSRRRR